MQTRQRASLLFLGLLCLIITLTGEIEIPVGVILDGKSSLGSMALNGINMGLHDFYSQHPYYTTRLHLHIRDSPNNLLTAASAARDLINNKSVYAVLGPQDSDQASYVVELGNKTQVPVIWFSTSGPSLLPPASRFSISHIQSRCFQFRAIADIIEAFNWQSVVPIYEDPEFGNDLIPCLTYALKDKDARVHNVSAIDPHSNNTEINEKLHELKAMQTNVYLVHMTRDLGSRLIKLAKKAKMMDEGYAWLLTQELSSLNLQGALGVRPRFKGRYNCNLTLYGCWAYDTFAALATAVENVHRVNSTFFNTNRNNQSRVDPAGRGRDDIRPELLKAIEATMLIFNLSEGLEEPSVFEVYNVKEQGERNIGDWSPQGGLTVRSNRTGVELPGKYKWRIGVPITYFKEFVDVKGQNASPDAFAVKVFEQVVEQVFRVSQLNLSYAYVPLPNKTEEQTPWPYDDEHLCGQIENEKLDAIIGDITIVASRTKCVDFTLPYLDSRVSMVVMVRPDIRNGWILFKPFHWLLWLIIGGIFLGASIIVILLEGNFFYWLIKKKKKEGNKNEGNSAMDANGSKSKKKDQSGSKSKKIDESGSESKKMDGSGNKSNETKRNGSTPKKMLCNPFLIYKSENGSKPKEVKELIKNPFLIYKSDIDKLKSSTSQWMVILISFLLLLVVQVYTANLTSILTERTTAKPSSWKDIQEIKRKNRPVGYQKDSWVKGLLIEQIGFKEDHLIPLKTPDDYYNALLEGRDDETKGVAAIFDETPYLNLFLYKYNHSSSCKMAGPIYKTGGFAFAFRKNSSLVSNFSSAILNVTQNTTTFVELMSSISLRSTIDSSEYKSNVETRSLKIEDFGGFFYVVLSVFGLFFILSLVKLGVFKKIKPVVVCIFKCLRAGVIRLLISVKLVCNRCVAYGEKLKR